MLDIVLFRTDQGGDPDRIRKSQKDRYADVGLVDKVIEIDTEWRKTRGDLDDAKKAKGITQKGITEAMKKKETPAPELLEAKKAHEEKIAALEEKEKTLLASRQETIGLIGNLLPEDGSVPVALLASFASRVSLASPEPHLARGTDSRRGMDGSG